VTSVLDPIPHPSTVHGDWKDILPPFEELGARAWLSTSSKDKIGETAGPERIIIPWTTTWMNHDFNEVVLTNAFEGAREFPGFRIPMDAMLETSLFDFDHIFRDLRPTTLE
jgi:hypothetical protein